MSLKWLDTGSVHDNAAQEVAAKIILTKEMTMNIDKLAPIAAVIVALIAVVVVGGVDRIPGGYVLDGNAQWFILILMAIGLVHGLMSPVTDHASQALAIVAAFAFPRLADTLDSIPAVGMYLNQFVDQLAIAIAGYAIAALINETKSRIMAD
ncbi:MAG: hypothetical protein CMQ42_05435 [Gammaproteobacteria bacterium]|uniref:Uncharacterized protein n=1 Tax=marine metagenome TaxID=408172 RepID=A0A381RI59_9ZZZZ|nr:hypothetical protein [Gammaproteobacteria bacterium]